MMPSSASGRFSRRDEAQICKTEIAHDARGGTDILAKLRRMKNNCRI